MVDIEKILNLLFKVSKSVALWIWINPSADHNSQLQDSLEIIQDEFKNRVNQNILKILHLSLLEETHSEWSDWRAFIFEKQQPENGNIGVQHLGKNKEDISCEIKKQVDELNDLAKTIEIVERRRDEILPGLEPKYQTMLRDTSGNVEKIDEVLTDIGDEKVLISSSIQSTETIIGWAKYLIIRKVRDHLKEKKGIHG